MTAVTQKEFMLPEDLVILSTSDLQGHIVDYNAGFRDASGYSDAELRGKPHSMLRHPDMPKEAFADFWTTLKAGLSWNGVVKNKRKNGDHYWVVANAAPIIENGQVKGYVSVRYPASRNQIAEAERLYSAIRSGAAKMPKTVLNSGVTKSVVMGGLLSIAPVSWVMSGIVLSSSWLVACSIKTQRT